MGVERTPNKELAHKVNPGEENYPATPAGIELATFQLRVQHMYQVISAI